MEQSWSRATDRENLCPRWKKNHQPCTHPTLRLWLYSSVMTELELSLKKLRYALSKQIWSRIQKSRAMEFAMSRGKAISFSDSYIVQGDPGDRKRELTKHSILEHGIPTRTLRLNSWDSKRWLQMFMLGRGGSEKGHSFKDADFGEIALHKGLFVSVP